MKLILVILGDGDADAALDALMEADFRATRVATTGGFLRRGNTTLFIGADDSRVEPALDLIRKVTTKPEDPGRHRAVVFVLNVARFEQLD